MDPRIVQSAKNKIFEVASKAFKNGAQVLSNPAGYAASQVFNSPKVHEGIRMGRQFAEQMQGPALNKIETFLDKIPAPVFQTSIPGFSGQLAKDTFKLALPTILDQPASFLRGAEYLVNPERRAEVSQMDLMGKVGAIGDVSNLVPMGGLVKTGSRIPSALVKTGSRIPSALEAAQASLGQVGKIKLGPSALQKLQPLAEEGAGGIFSFSKKLGAQEYDVFNKAFQKAQNALDIQPEVREILPKDLTGHQAYAKINGAISIGEEPKNLIEDIAEGLKKYGYRGIDEAREIPKIATKAEALEKMTHLLNYPNELLKRGYTKGQINYIGSGEARNLIADGVEPFQWADRKLMPWAGKPAFPPGKAKIKSAMPKVPEPAIHTSLDGAKEAFSTWVNARRASPIQGLISKRAFSDLDEKGLEGIFEFQAGNKTGRFEELKNFFDQKHSELIKSGLNLNYKEDYLPQLWANTPKEIDAVFGKSLTQKPSFALDSIFADYEEGIAAGLKPKFQTVGELAGWYDKTATKTLADRDFFNFLKKKGFIVSDDVAPRNFVTLNPDKFPKEAVRVGDATYRSNFKAEPELAKLINNYLSDPGGPLQLFASLATRVKNIGLAGGIPGTALNYHGVVNIFRRDLLSSDNPIKTFLRDAVWMVHPNSANAYVQKNLNEASFFVKHGLTISSEDWTTFVKDVPSSRFGKLEAQWEKWFGDPLFKKVLPAIKIEFTKSQFAYLSKTMPESGAAKKASELANTVFGGINLDQLGRSKDTQNFLRSIILAPDWGETTLRIGKGLYSGFRHPFTPEYKTYRTIARNLVAFYAMENLLNKALSGHWMFENEGAVNKVRIDTGTYDSDGKKRYFTPWGTSQDFVRIPYEIVTKMMEGKIGQAIADPLVNRFSMPLSMASHLLTNQDYLHRPIYGNDTYGNQIPASQQAGNVFNQVAQGFGAPVQMRALIDYMTGKSSGEESIAQALEVPVRYVGGAFSKSQKTLQGIGKAEGLTGEALYNLNETTRGVSFSEKQTELLREGGTKLLDPLLALKDARSKEYKIREITEQMSLGELEPEEGEKQIQELMNTPSKFKVKRAGENVESTHASGFPNASIVTGDEIGGSDMQTETGEILAKMRVKSSGKPETHNGKYYYMEGGDLKNIQTDRKLKTPNYSGSPGLDKELKSTYDSSISSKITDIGDLFSQGQISRESAASRISALKALKSDQKLEAPNYTGDASLDKELQSDYHGQITSKINAIVDQFSEGLLSSEAADTQIAALKAIKALDKARGKKQKTIKAPVLKKAPTIKSKKLKLRKFKLPKTELEAFKRKK